MDAEPLSQEELDAMRCACCECDDDVLYFHPRCHDYAKLTVRYERGLGQMVVACAMCDREVMRIAVAETLD
jgi:hypothetical protein